jgi:multiple sugar transport system permease protein
VALLFLAPNFLGFAVFTAIPILFSFAASFTDWNLTRPGRTHWTGLDNLRRLWSDHHFWIYLVNTLYLMLGIPVSIALSLCLALLLHRDIRGSVAYRTVLYLPTFTAGVALMLLWSALLNPEAGPINAALRAAIRVVAPDSGLSPPRWLTSIDNLLGLQPERVGLSRRFLGIGAREAILLLTVWTAAGGNTMLLYAAALGNVPAELYEAADIDGAGRWQRFRAVTWPQLAPTTTFVVVMAVIGGLQGGFEQARVLTEGGPAGTTTTLSYYIYTQAFEQFEVGYASAVSWVLFLMTLAFALAYWRYGNQEADV